VISDAAEECFDMRGTICGNNEFYYRQKPHLVHALVACLDRIHLSKYIALLVVSLPPDIFWNRIIIRLFDTYTGTPGDGGPLIQNTV
jgi:hypothetical protein